jgi:hypothetical protein
MIIHNSRKIDVFNDYSHDKRLFRLVHSLAIRKGMVLSRIGAIAFVIRIFARRSWRNFNQ